MAPELGVVVQRLPGNPASSAAPGGPAEVPSLGVAAQRAAEAALPVVQLAQSADKPEPAVVQAEQRPLTGSWAVQRFAQPAEPTERKGAEPALPVVVARAVEEVVETRAPVVETVVQRVAEVGPQEVQRVEVPVQGQGADELLRKLYDPLLRRLKADLWLDRERRGALTDM